MFPTVTIDQPDRVTLYVIVAEPVTLGRECDGLLLADEKVSRQHLQLAPSGSDLIVTDLESTNGSFIDGERISGRVMLAPGSTLMLGDTKVRLGEPPHSTVAQTTRRDAGGTIVATLGSEGDRVRPSATAGATRETSIEKLAQSLGNEPLSVPSGGVDDTVTIMFSDIESSTELALGMGDERWYQVLTQHNNLLEQRVAAHGGFIVKSQGDGFMVTFNSARRAIICASEIQQGLYTQATNDPSSAVRVRIGLHTGEAIRQDSGDLFGRHVIIAARIGALADGGEILVSSIVEQIASARGDLYFGEAQNVELKGVGAQQVHSVLWGAELPTS